MQTNQKQIKPKQKQKLSDKFKELSQQQFRKQPPIYLINSIKDKTIMLDLDLLQSDDVMFLSILFKLPITKIHLYCEEGKKIGNNVPIYSSMKFKDLLKEIGNVISCVATCKSLIFQRVPVTVRNLMVLKENISTSQNLKQLSFKYCSLTDQHLQSIKSAIAKNQSLVILDLSHNKLCNVGGMVGKIMSQHSARRDQLIWFASLRSQPLQDDLSKKGICEVNLQANQINDQGAIQLISFLKDDQWSRCLNLRQNKLTEVGIKQFAKLMKKNNSLISLDLRGNPGFNKEYSVYILKKLKQNIEKYRQQKQTYVKTNKNIAQQNQTQQIQDKNKHKSLQQSRRQSLYKKTQNPTLQFTLSNNNITALPKNRKNLTNKLLATLDQHSCSRCKQITLDMLKLSKHNLDLQLQIKKLKHILLTKNIDISAILPHSHTHINHNNSNIIQPLHRALQLQFVNNGNNNTNGESDEDLINKVQHILLQLTKIMDNIDVQHHTQVNVSNNISNAHSLSNTIPLFAHPEQLEELQLEQSSIEHKKSDKNQKQANMIKIQQKEKQNSYTNKKPTKKSIINFSANSENAQNL